MIKGKNYEVINEYGIQYKITNKHNKFFHFIVKSTDISADIFTKKDDYVILIKDLDGEYFAQPIDSSIIIEKLMSGWEGSTLNMFSK